MRVPRWKIFHRHRRVARVQLLSHELKRNAVVVAFDLDVIIDIGTNRFPVSDISSESLSASVRNCYRHRPESAQKAPIKLAVGQRLVECDLTIGRPEAALSYVQALPADRA